ncbi:MAG: phage integrase central domain-containing protein [Armatimonadota bacterium]
MPRPRKRGNLERKTVRRKGVASPVRVTRQRVDGSSYDVWRCPYYAWTWTSRKPTTPPIIDGVPDEEALIWDHERHRRYAQGDTPEASANEAERLAQSYEEYNEWFQVSPTPLTYEDWIASNKGVTADCLPASADLGKLEDPPATSRTFSSVANEYIDSRGKYDHRGNFVPISNGYRNKIRNYLMHAGPIDKSPMAELKLPEVTQWFTAYQRGQSQATAARYKKWCLAIGRYAANAGYWKKNHFDSLPNLSLQPVRLNKRVFTLAEIDALWDASSSVQQRALMILLRLGLRFGEATGLTKDCLLDDDTIQIRYSQVRVRQSMATGAFKMLPMLDRPKTRSSMAQVVVPEPWMNILRESVQLSDATLIRAWDDDPELGARLHNFVVSNAKGTIWQESPALEAMKRTMQRA